MLQAGDISTSSLLLYFPSSCATTKKG